MLICMALMLPSISSADEAEPEQGTDDAISWYLQGGGYRHWKEKESYVGDHWFLGIERHNHDKNLLWGLSVFDNSFGDFSQYLYVGRNWYPFDKLPHFRFRLTGGIVHGYSGENQDISPLNWGDAWAIGAVPGIGYQKDNLGVDVAILSASGLLLLVGYEF